MLRLYDLSGSNVSARQVDGILALEQVPATTWMSGRQFASVVRGLEIRKGSRIEVELIAAISSDGEGESKSGSGK